MKKATTATHPELAGICLKCHEKFAPTHGHAIDICQDCEEPKTIAQRFNEKAAAVLPANTFKTIPNDIDDPIELMENYFYHPVDANYLAAHYGYEVIGMAVAILAVVEHEAAAEA